MEELDPELQAIRQKRMSELQLKGSGMPTGTQMSPEAQKEKEEQNRRMEEQRQTILAQILTSEARERLARVSLVKPEKARNVEDMIIRAAQTGNLAEKVDESKLISLLEQISEKNQQKTKITIQRKKAFDDDF